MRNVHGLTVGGRYHPHKVRWPEANQYSYDKGGHSLTLFLESPTEDEIESVRAGVAEFGFVVEGSALFLLYRFVPGVPWSDAPYSYWLVASADRQLPNPEPTDLERELVTVILVDAADGIVKTLRALTWSPEFSAAIDKEVRTQARSAFNGQEHDKAIARAYRRWGTTEDMVSASGVRCSSAPDAPG